MRRRGLCLTPFAPQRIVAATRAYWGFYRRPRAPPRRPGASSRKAPGLATRGAGLAARLRYGKGRARPEGTLAAVRGVGVGINNARVAEQGELGRAREGCGARRGAEESPPPPSAAWVLQSCPAQPVLQRLCAAPLRPWEPFRDCGEGRGRTHRRSQARDAAAQAGKTPCPFRVISPECWLSLSTFLRRRLGAGSVPVLLGAGAKKIR